MLRFGSRLILAIGILLGVTLTSGCRSNEQRFAAHLQRAEKYTQEQKHAEAYIELKNALKLNPNDSKVNQEIAKCLQSLGQTADAIFYYQEARRLDPKNEEAALALAGLLLGSDLEQAEKIVDEIIAANPKNSRAYVRKSEIALVRSNWSGALQWANKALEIAPLDALNHLHLGRVHRAQIRKAKHTQESVDPSLYAAAEAEFQRALEIDPTLSNATLELARIYASWPGHEKAAEEAFRNAFMTSLEKKDTALQTISLEALTYAIRTRNENFELWVLEKTVDAMPENLTAWMQYANFETQHGRSGEQVLQRLLDRQPENIAAHVLYAKYLQDKNKWDKAIQHLNETAQSVKNPEPALSALIDLYIRRERIEDARAVLTTMLKKYPSHAQTQLAHAQVLFAEHKDREARDLLKETTVALDDAAAWRLLALAEYNLSNFPEALKAINKAIERAKPPTAAELRLKAQILHASQDWSGTLNALRDLAEVQHSLEPADRLRLAQALFGMNKIESGKKILESLFKEEKILVGAVLEYAERFGKDDPKTVRGLIEKALVQSPSNPRLLYHLTQLDLTAGNKNAAIERLRHAVSTQKNVDASTYILLGRLLATEKEFGEARTYAVKAFLQDPNAAGSAKFLLDIHYYLKEPDKAITLFEEAEKANRLSLPNQHLLTQIWVGNQKVEQAEALLEKILKENPDYAPAKNDLAYLLAERNEDLERALKLAESARQQLANNPDSADTLGLVYLRKKLYPAAVQQFRTAIELAKGKTDNPIYYFHLGQALRENGDNLGAIQSFEKALSLSKNFPGADTAQRELKAAKAETEGAG